MISGRKITLGSSTSAKPQEIKMGEELGGEAPSVEMQIMKAHTAQMGAIPPVPPKMDYATWPTAAVVATALSGPATRAIITQVRITITMPGRSRDCRIAARS